MDADPYGWVRCRACGNRLGKVADGKVVIRHKGREITGTVEEIRCEKCGSVWTPTTRDGVACERATNQRTAAS